jgi:hypothetical protein
MRPEFGTEAFAILTELQHLVCNSYVHLYRMIAFSERRNKVDSTEGDWARIEKQRRLSALSNADEEALMMTAGRLRRWLMRAQEDGLIANTVGERFKELESTVKTVRDMREHYDEYLQGKGRRQEEFVHLFPTEDNYVIPTTARISLSYNGVYHIGGRVALNDIALSIREIFDDLQSADLWVLPWNPHQLVHELSEYTPQGEG